MDLVTRSIHNDLQAVKEFIAGGADVNAVDDYGRTALLYAADEGHVECAAALVDAKADVNKTDAYDWTPLHCASLCGRVECVRLLLHHKANVNALNKYGSSPLNIASLKGLLASVQILIAAGAERDRPNKGGYTPLAVAIECNRLNVAEFLLHSDAKMNNVKPSVKIPYWMTGVITKRCNVISFTLVLKGLLKRRLGLSKDVTHLIALYFWNTRLK